MYYACFDYVSFIAFSLVSLRRVRVLGIGIGIMVGCGEGVSRMVGESGFRCFYSATTGLEVTFSDVASKLEEGNIKRI